MSKLSGSTSILFITLFLALSLFNMGNQAHAAITPQVLSSGGNDFGQLGDGTTEESAFPLPTGLTGAIDIAAGNRGSMALMPDGTVWVWGMDLTHSPGYNNWWLNTSPVQMPNLTNVVAIAAGYGHAIVLKDDGTVWCWGRNEAGQAGYYYYKNGTRYGTYYVPKPVKVMNLTDVVAISAGNNHSLALKADGTVWAWGANTYYQLGTPSTFGSKYVTHIPVKVEGLSSVVAIGAGVSHSLAVKDDGTVWGWGYNSFGQLGNDDSGWNARTPEPQQVIGITDAEQVDGGHDHSLALLANGEVWAWGANNFNQLGDGTTVNSTVPIQVTGLSNILDISAGSRHNLAVTSDGNVWGWGHNYYGELGDGSTGDGRSNLVENPNVKHATTIAAGVFHSVFLGVPAGYNEVPTADAGPDQIVVQGDIVYLDGNSSFDPDQDPLTYWWEIVAKPAGSNAVIVSPESPYAQLVTDLPGSYVLSLVVDDGLDASAPNQVALEAITYEEAVDKALQDLGGKIDSLTPVEIKNRNMQGALQNKIDAITSLIYAGDYQEALDKLKGDILGKTDGCVGSGQPDKNDWVMDCGTQGEVYTLITQLIGYLGQLI